MEAPLAASVNMHPRYDGVGDLRRSDGARIQAYLVSRIRRIDTTAHPRTYAAYQQIRWRKFSLNLALCLDGPCFMHWCAVMLEQEEAVPKLFPQS